MASTVTKHAKCPACPIRHRAVCACCGGGELARLEAIRTYKTYAAHEPIIWRGDDLTHFSSVVSGIASLTKSLEDGRTQMVGLLLPSDFIGRIGRSAKFDVTAVSGVTLCCLQRQPFETLLREMPHVSHRMMEMALDELDAARDWMVLLGRKTAQEKIATFLDMFLRRSGDGGDSVYLPLTREEIANFLGLTLETVSRQFSILKKSKIIAFSDRRHFTVLDMRALHLASGEDADGGVIV